MPYCVIEPLSLVLSWSTEMGGTGLHRPRSLARNVAYDYPCQHSKSIHVERASRSDLLITSRRKDLNTADRVVALGIATTSFWRAQRIRAGTQRRASELSELEIAVYRSTNTSWALPLAGAAGCNTAGRAAEDYSASGGHRFGARGCSRSGTGSRRGARACRRASARSFARHLRGKGSEERNLKGPPLSWRPQMLRTL